MPAPQFVTVLCLLLDGGPPSVDESSPPSRCLQFLFYCSQPPVPTLLLLTPQRAPRPLCLLCAAIY
jgi:hypothetical protein